MDDWFNYYKIGYCQDNKIIGTDVDKQYFDSFE